MVLAVTRAAHLALAALALSGCSLLLDGTERPSNRCSTDADCAMGTCDPELALCVAEPDAPYRVAIAITLPPDRTGRPQLTANVLEISAAHDAIATLPVRRPVRVEGRVRSETVVLEADLVFSPRETRVGAPIAPMLVSTASAEGNPLERANDFATELFPGSYDVEVRPRGEDSSVFPPFRATLELEGPQHVDVMLPAARTYDPLGGWVVDAAGVGQDGLEVRAIEIETGRLVSSVATTATEAEQAGAFHLHVDPAAGRWLLQVSAPADFQAVSAFPTIAIDPSVLVPVDAEGRVQLLVPSPESGRCFAGLVELGPLRPAIGASVTMRARDIRDVTTGIVGSFTVQMVTSPGTTEATGCSGAPLAAGGFEHRVLPGTYDVEIRPLEQAVGVYVGQVVIGDTDQLGQIFPMPSRTVIGGLVQLSSEDPIADAQVRAIPQRVPLPFAPTRVEALLNRPGEAVSDATGRFSLPLDVGVYDLVVEPPTASGFPWIVRPSYGIGGSAAAVTEVLDVRPPAAVPGSAFFEDGEPVSDAQIDVYAIVGVDGLERAVPIGRASTDAEGAFLLLLPPAI